MSTKHPRALSNLLGMAPTQSQASSPTKPHHQSFAANRLTLDSDRYQQLKQNLEQISRKKENQSKTHRMFRVKSEIKMKDGALKFKEQIGRIQLLRKGKITTQQPLNIVFEVLNWLGKNDNFYTTTFAYIAKRLEQETIFNEQKFDSSVVKEIIKKTNNQRLIKAIYSDGSIMVTYKEICKDLGEELLKHIQGMERERSHYQEYIEELNRLLLEKRDTINKMKDTVKYYSSHPSQDLYPYIEELEQKVKVQAKEIEDQMIQNKETISNIQVLVSTNALLSDKIDDLSGKLYEIEIQKLSGVEKVQKNSELAEFQSNVITLKSMLDKSVVRMLGMKEEFERLKNQNERLVSERSQLAKRAAVGFSELTPRPNIKKIFEQNEIDYSKIYGQSEQMKISTETLVKTLISKFKKMYVNFKETEVGRKIVLDPLGKPINKFKNPTEDMINELRKGKEMIKQTEHAAEMLKTRHTREVEKKKKLMEERNNNK